MAFKRREAVYRGARVLLLVLALTYVVAVAHGIVTIDVARDLYWAIEIASGRVWPLLGPPVGSFELLGPVWYYIAAAAATASMSLTAYFALLGALAALKFVLIYQVGLRWLGAHFAVVLVVAATLPGVVSYQFFGIGHPQFVEAAIWATALFALRLRAAPESVGNAAALGLFAALAVHAHPTAIVLLPWAAVAVLGVPRADRLRAASIAALAALLVFLPRVFALLAGSSVTSATSALPENVAAASGLGGSIGGVWPILQNLFWFQPAYVVETTLSSAWLASAWPALWSLLLTLSLIGATIAAFDRQLRATFWFTLLTLLGVLVAITLLRDHTPFYMLYVALPPLAVLYALAWTALSRFRGGSVVVACLIAVVAALHIAVSFGYVRVARVGLIQSRLPLHSNMKNTATTTHVESISAAPTRDAMAGWLCAQTSVVALHGDIAAAYDIGLGQEQFFHCRKRQINVAAGGRDNPWIGLPLPVWRELAIAPAVVLGTYGLMPASRVVAPSAALQQVSGRAYPPRFVQMIAAARHSVWQAQTKANGLLVISGLLPTSPLFSATVAVDGVVQRPITQFANTTVFRCNACGALEAKWDISIRSGAPDTTSITVLDPGVTSAPSARLMP